ncbi:MAG TPA: hypothetical protein VFR13_08170 [Jiangellaceae bacterium]|nr:hypothetical protein [Jiangellaceae bacterium]
MSTPAIWSFVVVAVAFVGVVAMLVRACLSTYRRGRRLAEELTALGVDVEKVMAAVGPPTTVSATPRGAERTIGNAGTE